MIEPTAARPVPGPPRAPGGVDPDDETVPGGDRSPPTGPGERAFGDLGARPLGEHLAVFEAEHDRLQRELGTIDQL